MAVERSMDKIFIDKLTEVLKANLENEHFGVKELAKAMGVSRSQLHRKVHAINNSSTSQFIREFRLKKAMVMLQNNVATASEIAYRVGFSSPTYFNTCFRDYYGYPPGEVKHRTMLNVEETDLRSSDQVVSKQNPITTTSLGKVRFNKRPGLILSVVILALIAIAYTYFSVSKSNMVIEGVGNIAQDKSIAVIPFKNWSGDPNLEYVSDGMTDAVISRLTKIQSIDRVIPFTSMVKYKETDKSIPEIAKELGIKNILQGNFQLSGDRLKINLQLIDGPLDNHFWSHEYSGEWQSNEIFKIQAEVAENVAKNMNVMISDSDLEAIQKIPTDNLEAYDSYLKGSYILSNPSIDNIIASRKYFEKAIKLDSLFVEAYLGLSRSYKLMGVWNGNMSYEEAEQLAFPYLEKTLQLDPNNPSVLNELAWTKLLGWNFTFADSLFQELRSQDQKVVNDYQPNLMFGRYDKVIQNSNSFLKENPLGLKVRMPLAYAYYYKGQIDSTLYTIKESLRMDPFNIAYYDHFGNIFIALEDYEKAKSVLEKGLEISDKRHASMVVHLAIVYHHLGDEEKSLHYLNEVVNRAISGEPEINVFLSHYYSHMSNMNEAFKWLEIAFEKHEVDLIWLKVEPNLANLREDPRYKALYKKMGFPKIE